MPSLHLPMRPDTFGTNINSERNIREIKFEEGTEYAIVMPASLEDAGYTTHTTLEDTVAAARLVEDSNVLYEILDTKGHRHIRDKNGLRDMGKVDCTVC